LDTYKFKREILALAPSPSDADIVYLCEGARLASADADATEDEVGGCDALNRVN
jgi:hypothetical protein